MILESVQQSMRDIRKGGIEEHNYGVVYTRCVEHQVELERSEWEGQEKERELQRKTPSKGEEEES